MKNFVEDEADALEDCVDILLATPTLDEPMPNAQLSDKGSGKGRPLRVPQMGDEDGPVWVEDGWVFGYKLWVGDLPSDINSKVIGQCCVGYKDMSAQSRRTHSGMADAVITFTDEALAIKAFEDVSMTKFDHGGALHWPLVRWYKSARRCPGDGQQANA